MTQLQNRAAAALDMTHFTNKGVQTPCVREVVAAWLDGRKLKVATVRKAVAYLEMIARL
jgi:hypothetical protein